EQASGGRGAITTATDVYGLGALLYALLCGQPPFKGETVLQTLEQVRTREPDAPSGSNPRIDRDLQTICFKCLGKEPDRRYPTARARAQAGEGWLAGEPIRARRAGTWEQVRKWVRRRPTLAALLAVSAVALGVLLIESVWHNQQLQA